MRIAFSIVTIILFWASSFVAIKIALVDLSPLNLSLTRFIISSMVLGILACIKRPEAIKKKDFFRFLIAGLFGVTIYNITLNFGQQTITAGSASFLINTVPVLTTILALFLLKEQFNPRTFIGIILSLVGVGLITLSESQEVQFNLGVVLIAAFSQAIFFIIQKSLLKRYRPLTVISYSVWLGTLFLLPFSSNLHQTQNAGVLAIASLMFLGIFPGAIGHIIWSFVLSKMSASKATSFLYFVPVTSIFLSYLLVDEIPSILLILGGAIAIFGVYIVNRKNK